MQDQKISILPPQKGLEFPGGVGGSIRPKNLKTCMKLNWNFQRGLRKNPFHEGRYGYFLELHNEQKINVSGKFEKFQDFCPRNMESCHFEAARRVKLWSLNANLFFEEPHQLTKFT